MTFCINHDIAVVSIFDLKNIANKTISSKRLTEIQPCLLKGFGPLTSKLICKIMNKPGISTSKLFFNTRYCHTILNKFKYSTLLTSTNYFIRFKPQIKFLLLENRINLTYQLNSKLILSDLIIRLNHNTK